MFPSDGLLTVKKINDVDSNLDYTIPGPLRPDDCFNVFSPNAQFLLTASKELFKMNSVEDEQSSLGLNGRLRPRKSNGRSPQPVKASRRTEGKGAQDRSKKSCASSKTSPNKLDDLANKSDFSLILQLLCPYCDRKFSSKQSLSKHNRRTHFASAKQDGFIKCMHCNLAEADPNNIIRHMVDSHPNQYFACLDCHTRFPSTTELAEHKLNVCEKQKQPYRNKLRRKVSSRKNRRTSDKSTIPRVDREYQDGHNFNGIVISCELKPSNENDAADIEDNITTNLILPPNKSLVKNATLDKNAVIVLDDIQWNKRMPPNFSFHNTDADQILSRLGVVHRSPRTSESTRRDWFKAIDDSTQKFEKCFDTSFYSKVASNVQENLSKYLDGSFNSNPDPDNVIKTRKAKNSVVINTAEGFPILLACNQYSRNVFEGYNMPRAIAPKHKWKWENLDVDKSTLNPDQIKRDSHANNCIISLVSSLDIWTQLCMRNKFEDKFSSAPIEKKTEKRNIISKELKEILESREIPPSSSIIVKPVHKQVVSARQDFPAMLGLVPATPVYNEPPAVLSGEWVRPRCYVCCACGEQMYDARGLSSHKTNHHPNAQVQHYEIAGEENADIVKHLYVPPSQTCNRTRPPRGIRECTKCKTTISLEDLHQHMLDCAGDTPAVRRKCRNRPFGVRKRRTRIPDKTMRKKIRKHIRNRRARQNHVRPRPRIRSEVGDAETIRKMLADLPAKRQRVMVNPLNLNTASRNLENQRSKLLVKRQPTEIRNRENSNEAIINKNGDGNVNNDEQKKNISKKSDEEDKPIKSRMTRIVNKKLQRDGLKRKLSRPMRNTTRFRRQIAKQIISEEPVNDNDDKSSNVTNEQLSINDFPQKIDLLAQPYNARQNSDRDGANNREGHEQPVNDNNQNRNAQNDPAPANVPLKHSIARLTANSETHDKSVQFHQNFLVQQECNNIDDHSGSEQQLLFENEVVANELDKPPLQCEPVEIRVELNLSDQNGNNEKVDSQSVSKNKLNKPRKGLNDCIAMLMNKLVEPIPKSSGHVSVQCGSDEPLYPLPLVSQKPEAATADATSAVKVPINQARKKNVTSAMKICTTIDVTKTDTLLELPKRTLNKITEKGSDIKNRSKSGKKNVKTVQPKPEQKHFLSSADGIQKYNMKKIIAVEQDSVSVIQKTNYKTKVLARPESSTLIQESVLLPHIKSISKPHKYVPFIQEPEFVLQKCKSIVNQTSDNISPTLENSSQLDLIKRKDISSKPRENAIYPYNKNDIDNFSPQNKLGEEYISLREFSVINNLNQTVHKDDFLIQREIRNDIQSNLTKEKSNIICRNVPSVQLSSNTPKEQNSNRKHSEKPLVEQQNSNNSKTVLGYSKTPAKDVLTGPLDLSGKINIKNKLQKETSSFHTDSYDCLDLTNKRLDGSLASGEVVDLRVKIIEKHHIPIYKAHITQTSTSVIDEEITDLSTKCSLTTPTDLSVRAKGPMRLTNCDRNFGEKPPSFKQVNLSNKLDAKNITSIHDQIPHVQNPFSLPSQENYNLSKNFTNQMVYLDNCEVPTDLSRKEKDRSILMTAGCSTQNKMLLDASTKSLSHDPLNSKIINSDRCKDQKQLHHPTLNILQHQKVISTTATAISIEQRRTTLDVCSKINSTELTGESDFLVSNTISNINPTKEKAFYALSNSMTRENTVVSTTLDVTSAKNFPTQASTVCFEKIDNTKPVYTMSNANTTVTKLNTTGCAVLTNTSQGIPSTWPDTSIIAPLNYSIMASPSCDNMSNNLAHTTVTSLEQNTVSSYKIQKKNRDSDNIVTHDSDQDPETAKKIAMLPKELVDILGTMPIDHRNQLLNVLPQYVSTTPPTMSETVNLEKCYDLPHRQNLATVMANSICNNTKKSELLCMKEINTNVIQNLQNITYDRTKSTFVADSEESNTNSKLNIYPDSVVDTENLRDLNEIIDLTTEEINYSEDVLQEDKVMHGVDPVSQADTVVLTTTLQKEYKTNNERTASLRAVRIRTPSERQKSNSKLLIDPSDQEVSDITDNHNKVQETLKNDKNISRQENAGMAFIATNISVNTEIYLDIVENESSTKIINTVKEMDTMPQHILINESKFVHSKKNITESDSSPILIQADPHTCTTEDEHTFISKKNIEPQLSTSCVDNLTPSPDIKEGPIIAKNQGKDEHLNQSTANAEVLFKESSVSKNIRENRELSIDELRLQDTNDMQEDDSDDNVSLALVKQKQNEQQNDQISSKNVTVKTMSLPKTRRKVEKRVSKKQNIKEINTDISNLVIDKDLIKKVSFNLSNPINKDDLQINDARNQTDKIRCAINRPYVSLRKSKRNKRENTQQHGDDMSLELCDNKHKNNILTRKENFISKVKSNETIQTDNCATEFGNNCGASGNQHLHLDSFKAVIKVQQDNGMNRDIYIPPSPVNCEKSKLITDTTQAPIELTRNVTCTVVELIEESSEQFSDEPDNTLIPESINNYKCYFDQKKNKVHCHLSKRKKKRNVEKYSRNFLEKLYLDEVLGTPSSTKIRTESKELEKIDDIILDTNDTFEGIQKEQSPILTKSPQEESTPVDLGIEINLGNVLRRSSRVKSVFSDSAPVQTDRPEMSTDHKIPLTKKQLIFSKLLLDEDKFGQSAHLATELKKCSTVTLDKIDGLLFPQSSLTPENEPNATYNQLENNKSQKSKKSQYLANTISIEDNIAIITDTICLSKKPMSYEDETVSTEIEIQKVKSKKLKCSPHPVTEPKDLLLLQEKKKEKCFLPISDEKETVSTEIEIQKLKSKKLKISPHPVTEPKDLLLLQEKKKEKCSLPISDEKETVSTEIEIQKVKSKKLKCSPHPVTEPKDLLLLQEKKKEKCFLPISDEKETVSTEIEIQKLKSKKLKISPHPVTEPKDLLLLQKKKKEKSSLPISDEKETVSTEIEIQKVKSKKNKNSPYPVTEPKDLLLLQENIKEKCSLPISDEKESVSTEIQSLKVKKLKNSPNLITQPEDLLSLEEKKIEKCLTKGSTSREKKVVLEESDTEKVKLTRSKQLPFSVTETKETTAPKKFDQVESKIISIENEDFSHETDSVDSKTKENETLTFVAREEKIKEISPSKNNKLLRSEKLLKAKSKKHKKSLNFFIETKTQITVNENFESERCCERKTNSTDFQEEIVQLKSQTKSLPHYFEKSKIDNPVEEVSKTSPIISKRSSTSEKVTDIEFQIEDVISQSKGYIEKTDLKIVEDKLGRSEFSVPCEEESVLIESKITNSIKRKKNTQNHKKSKKKKSKGVLDDENDEDVPPKNDKDKRKVKESSPCIEEKVQPVVKESESRDKNNTEIKSPYLVNFLENEYLDIDKNSLPRKSESSQGKYHKPTSFPEKRKIDDLKPEPEFPKSKISRKLSKDDRDVATIGIHLEKIRESTENKIEPCNKNLLTETRTACYNMPVATKRTRSKSTAVKLSEGDIYDPYDIDLDETIETIESYKKKKITSERKCNKYKSRPLESTKEINKISKADDVISNSVRIDKGEVTQVPIHIETDVYINLDETTKSIESDKKKKITSERKCNKYKIKSSESTQEENKITNVVTDDIITNSIKIDKGEITQVPVHIETDLDIDLDKTIESYKKKKNAPERKCNKYKSNSSESTKETNKTTKTDSCITNTIEIDKTEVTQVPIRIESGDKYKVIISDSDDSSKSDVPLTKYVKDTEKSIGVSEDHINYDGDAQNVSKSEKAIQTITNEKSCQTFTVCDNNKSVNTQNEIEEQLRSEQFMESFGFFSERKPRKSNLLATKKISETFHTIANEDELCFDNKDKAQKKSLQNESKKEIIENIDKITLPHFKCTAKRGRKKKRAQNAYCDICKKDFRRSDNYLRHQLTLYHISKLSEEELKVKTVRVREEPNYLITYKQHLDRLRVMTYKYNKRKKNSRAPKIKLPTLDDVVAEVNEIIMQQKLALRNLSTDEALFLDCCRLLKESHKKDPTISDVTGLVENVNDLVGPSNSSTTTMVFIEKSISDSEKCDTRSDGDVDSLTAKTILESEEVRNLENDLISGLKEAANASSLSKYNSEYQYESRNTLVENIEQIPEDYSGSNITKSCDEPVENFEDIQQTKKSKKNTDSKTRTVGDMSETIDLFEDKFDKIKRKSRSQAAAAKQTQTVVEQLKSRKGRKKSEKKGKKGKKNLHNTVLTKGALKGFDSIKVSTPITNDIVDLTTEPSSKKTKKTGTKKKVDKNNMEIISKHNNHNYNKDNAISQKKVDVYEFKDNDDVELFELRPSTLMERFKSINNKVVPSTSTADVTVEEIQNPITSDSDGDFVYMSDKYTDEENVSLTSLDSASKVGVDTKKTQKRKDAIEKNAVMGKIFKNNAVRTDKKKKCKDMLVSKANLDLLFDSLLKDEPNMLSEEKSKKIFTSPSSIPETSKKHDKIEDDFISFKKHDTSTPNRECKIIESPVSKRNSVSPDFSVHSPSDRLLSNKYDVSGSTGSGNDMEFNSPCTSKIFDMTFINDASCSSSKKNEVKKCDNSRDGDTYDNESLNDDDISVDKYGVKSKSKDKSTSEKVNKSESCIDIEINEDMCNQPSQFDETGVARQRTRRKCAVGKQNVLAETWSSESEPEMAPPRPKSALAVMVTTRKKRGRKKEGPSASGRRAKNIESRVSSSNQNTCACVSSKKEDIAESKTDTGSCEGAVVKEVLSSPVPVSSKPRPRPSTSYWSSDGDDEQEHLQQHGWIVGDSHKKLVTMLAHAKGRKRNHDEKRHFVE